MKYKYNFRTGVKKASTKLFKAKAVTGLVALATPAAIFLSTGGALAAGSYSLFGDAQIVSPGHNSPHAAQATTTGTHAFGGVDFGAFNGMTVSQLNNLSTDYMFTQGTCGLGSPRFSVGVTNGTSSGNLFFYIGPPPNYNVCPPNIWTNSGNLASSVNLVDATQLGGAFYEPYAAVQASYGSYTITDIALVVDGSNQTVQFDNSAINNNTYTYDQPANKDECKNGGWQSLTDQNGQPFKNQGQCVSWTNGRGQ